MHTLKFVSICLKDWSKAKALKKKIYSEKIILGSSEYTIETVSALGENKGEYSAIHGRGPSQ